MAEDHVAPIVLNSWKEIASYVGRGVRTVQRWEADLGMPVRRPRAKSRSAVIAMADEIDKWLRSAPTAEVGIQHHPETRTKILELRKSVAMHLDLRTRCADLLHEHVEARTRLMRNLHSLMLSVQKEEGTKDKATPAAQLEMFRLVDRATVALIAVKTRRKPEPPVARAV